MTPPSLPDIQRTLDKRGVPIHRVGVTGIKLPIQVRRKDPSLPPLSTVGTFELACSLAAQVKGTHMSRFTEVLNEHINAGGVFSVTDLQDVARELAARLESSSVYLKLEVDYFVTQNAPVSKRPGVAPVKGVLEVEFIKIPNVTPLINTYTGVVVDGKTCCPCSREISDYDHETGKGKGAHAQRSTVTISAHHSPDTVVWFEDLVEAAWQSYSSPIYPVLKRPDERAVTVGAYENPKFVEDVIRDVCVALREDDRLTAFTVRVENAESIHYHNAYAEVSEAHADTLNDE